MKTLTKIFTCVSALMLVSCGSGSDSMGSWKHEIEEEIGFKWEGIFVVASDGTVDPNPPRSLFDSEDEADREGYFHISYTCSLDFAEKYLHIGLRNRDFSVNEMDAVFSFDDDTRLNLTLDTYLSRLDFEDKEHRKAMGLFSKAQNKVEILVGTQLIVIPMTGFQKAYNKMPKECQMDKEFSLSQIAKAVDNEVLFVERNNQEGVDGFLAIVRAKFKNPDDVQYRKSKYYMGTVCTEASSDGENWEFFVYQNTKERLATPAADGEYYETLTSLCDYGSAVDLLKPLKDQNLNE